MSELNNYTHQDVVLIGAKWLKRVIKCPVVAQEIKCSGSREIPDVIGFRANTSFLIECKASRADFLIDFKKPERQGLCSSLGNYRLYLAPKGVIDFSKVPQNWGILEINEKGRVEVVRFRKGNIYCGNDSPEEYKKEDPFFHESDIYKERSMLYSLLRR
ncbi:hypothetical protein ACQWTT_001216 [Acinetobacter baumannii]